MEKSYDIVVDCANCAREVEEAALKTEGVKSCTVNFMTLKMIIKFEDGVDEKEVLKRVEKNCKDVEDEFEITY